MMAPSGRVLDRVAPLLSAVIAGLTLLAFLALTGADIGRALGALWDGAFGSSYSILSATLVRAAPLILTGLAVAWAFSAGVFNIGVEGQFLTGAAAATAVALKLPDAGFLLPLAAGALAGSAWAGIAAFLKARFAVAEVISTIMLNFIALQMVAYLVHGPLGDPRGIYPQSPGIDPAAWLPKLVTGHRLHLGFGIGVLACACAWFVKTRTAAGFRIRLVGASPSVARIGGRVAVDKVAAQAFLVSGAIAGAAGAIEVTGVTYALYESISPGYGYTAIAVALLANLSPALVVLSGIGFGALEAGAGAMQRDAGVPAVIVWVVQAIIILTLAAIHALNARSLRSRGPG